MAWYRFFVFSQVPLVRASENPDVSSREARPSSGAWAKPNSYILLFVFPLTIQPSDIPPSFEGISPHSEGFTARSVSAKLQHKQRRTAHDDHSVAASDAGSNE